MNAAQHGQIFYAHIGSQPRFANLSTQCLGT